MNDECPRCREYAERGASFCGACGRPLGNSGQTGSNNSIYANGPEEGLGIKADLEKLLLIPCIVILIIILFELVTLIVNGWDVFSFLSDKQFSMILIVPFPEEIFTLSKAWLQLYWIIIVIVLICCIGITMQKVVKKLRSPGGIMKSGSEDDATFWVTISFAVMIFINFITVAILLGTGNGPTTPDLGDNLSQMFSLADAAVWEEVIARLLYIGVPMTIISIFVTKKKDSLKCLLGGFGMSKAALIFIIISGIIFGLAHSPGWDGQVWKVVTAAMMGLLLGYVFVRFGLYASILLHFVNDYLSAFDWMGVGTVSLLITLFFIAFGIIALIYLLMRLWGFGKSFKSVPLFRGYSEKDH
jgi:hypothetical protein